MFPTISENTQDLKSMLNDAPATEVTGGGRAFIGFDPTNGNYHFGKDKEDITNTKIMVNTPSFTHGYVLWLNRVPTKLSVHFTQDMPVPMASVPAPTRQDPNAMAHPSEMRGFEARFADDENTILDYNTNTFGGRQGCDTLLKAIKLRSGSGEAEYLYPVISLESESYMNQHQGKLIFNPVFRIDGWVNSAGQTADAAPALEAEVKEAPKARVRKAS